MVDHREQYLIIKGSTGELVSIVHEGYRVIDRALYENWVALWKAEDAEPHNMGEYVKLAVSAVPVLREMGLTKIERGLIDLFAAHLRWNTNKIAYRNGKPISEKTMSLELGVSGKEIRKALTALREKGIVGGDLYMNPYCLFKGEFTRAALRKLFAGTAFHQAWEDSIGGYLKSAEAYREFLEKKKGVRESGAHSDSQRADGGV